MMLTGQRIKAQRAYDIGLINEVVPRAELISAVNPLGANPGLRTASLKALKQVVRLTGAVSGPGHGCVCQPSEALQSRTRTKACWHSRSANPSEGR